MPTNRRPRIHAPSRERWTPDPETVREVVGCRICHVAAGEYCLRVRRQGRDPIRRYRNHQVRVVDAIAELRRRG